MKDSPMSEKISASDITWQQVVVCIALLVAVVAAYKLFGEIPAGVLLILSSITNFLLGRPAPKHDTKGGAS